MVGLSFGVCALVVASQVESTGDPELDALIAQGSTAQESQTVDETLPVSEDVNDIQLRFPFFGEVSFNRDEGSVKKYVIKPGQTKQWGPLLFGTTYVELENFKTPVFKGKVTFLDKKAYYTIRDFGLATVHPEKVGEKSIFGFTGVKLTLELMFDKSNRPSVSVGSFFTCVLPSLDLIIDAAQSLTFVGKTTIGSVQVPLTMALEKGEGLLFKAEVPACSLSDLFKGLGGTVGGIEIDSGLMVIQHLFSKSGGEFQLSSKVRMFGGTCDATFGIVHAHGKESAKEPAGESVKVSDIKEQEVARPADKRRKKAADSESLLDEVGSKQPAGGASIGTSSVGGAAAGGKAGGAQKSASQKATRAENQSGAATKSSAAGASAPVKKTQKGSGNVFYGRIYFSDITRLYEVAPVLRGVTINSFNITASSGDFVDLDGNDIIEGLNIFGKVALTGQLEVIKKLTGGADSSLAFTLNVGRNPLEDLFRIEAELPLQFSFIHDAKVSVIMGMHKNGPFVALEGSVKIRPTQESELIKVGIVAQVDPASMVIKTVTKGRIKNMFGLKVDVEDLALEGGINIETGLPDTLAAMGICHFADHQVMLAGKIAPDGIGFEGSINKISLFELLKLVHAQKAIASLPNISISDVDLAFIPFPMTIGERKLPEGIRVMGMIDIMGTKAFVDLLMDKQGIKATGGATPIVLGPLGLRGDSQGYTKASDEYGEGYTIEAGGPQLHLEASVGRVPVLNFAAQFVLEKIFNDAIKIDFDSSGFKAHIESMMSGVYAIDLMIHGGVGGSFINAGAHLDFKQDFIDNMNSLVRVGVQIANVTIHAAMDNAGNNVGKLDDQIKDLKQQRDEKIRELGSL
jgi:hypothetical protein